MAYGNISAIGKCTLGTNVTMSNNVALMDDNNIIMLCDDMVLTGTHNANDILFTLPDSSMFPSQDIYLLGIYQPTSGTKQTRVFLVDTNGNFKCTNPAAGTYYLNGYLWHNNGKYYSNKVNASSQTSPLNLR